MNILDHIRIVPNFPKDGIHFYDIATLLNNAKAWKNTVWLLADKTQNYQPDLIMGIEARGFHVASALSIATGIGFGMVRKAGKLPGQVLSYSYDLEYGSDTIEIQPDLMTNGARVLLVDDLLATGGTMSAAEKLIYDAGAQVVANMCLIELIGLDGRDKLKAPFEALAQAPA